MSCNANYTSYEKGTGCIIRGSGNNFTVYLGLEGITTGIRVRMATVISGSVSTAGIRNLKYAFVMIEKGSDPNNQLMREGVFRIFCDRDGLSVPTSFDFSFLNNRGGTNNEGMIWHEYIRDIMAN